MEPCGDFSFFLWTHRSRFAAKRGGSGNVSLPPLLSIATPYREAQYPEVPSNFTGIAAVFPLVPPTLAPVAHIDPLILLYRCCCCYSGDPLVAFRCSPLLALGADPLIHSFVPQSCISFCPVFVGYRQATSADQEPAVAGADIINDRFGLARQSSAVRGAVGWLGNQLRDALCWTVRFQRQLFTHGSGTTAFGVPMGRTDCLKFNTWRGRLEREATIDRPPGSRSGDASLRTAA